MARVRKQLSIQPELLEDSERLAEKRGINFSALVSTLLYNEVKKDQED